jgi:hypothetical protein
MTKQNPNTVTTESPVNRGVTCETHSVADLIVNATLASTLADQSAQFPVFRTRRYSLRAALDVSLENLATSLPWRAVRIDETTLVMVSDGLLLEFRGADSRRYASLWCQIWAASLELATQVVHALDELLAGSLSESQMFSLDWYFLSPRGMLLSTGLEEMIGEPVSDLAYPCIQEGVAVFIDRYLASEETVLVLQGPPGTGKTHLIRQILGTMSRGNARGAKVMYTGDSRAMDSDEIFIEFISGDHDAFVVEDADQILKTRSGGNETLHRFLAIADGVVRAQGRKIIFSTNLPNLGDLDDALVRPGRCFARICVRRLTLEEALRLLDVLSRGSSKAHDALKAAGVQSFSLAEIYRFHSDLQRKTAG